MLTLLFIMSVFYQGHAVVNSGRDFVTAFPENIAYYYYPPTLTTYLQITSLFDYTRINVTFNSTTIYSGNLNSGQMKTVSLPGEVEEYQLNRSSKTVRITSDNDVTVMSYSKRGDSVQTNVVLPVDKLGNEYRIPFPNFTEIILMLNNYSPSGSFVPSYNFFRLLIINAEDKNNNVTISMQQSEQDTSETEITLSPFEFIQMQSNDSLVMVTASANIAVLLTHPCLDTYSCKCSMVVHQLRPTNLLGDSFIVPPLYMTNYSRIFATSDQSVELKYNFPSFSSSEMLDPGDFLPLYRLQKGGLSNITTSQPVSLKLINNGSLIDLIPVSMFSACYLLHGHAAYKSQALLIVETLKVQDLQWYYRYGSSQVTWNVINGTAYSWALMDINSWWSQIVWHPSSKFAVYILATIDSNVPYGGPAISISEEPDPKGCAMTPASFYVGNQSLNWQASIDYCTNKGGKLASPSWAKAHSAMAQKLKQVGATGQAWIGLRRSLLTLDWYWQSGQTYEFSNWDEDQPITPERGMCVTVRMEPNGNYTWSNVRCCSSLKPVCCMPPLYMYLNLYN